MKKIQTEGDISIWNRKEAIVKSVRKHEIVYYLNLWISLKLYCTALLP